MCVCVYLYLYLFLHFLPLFCSPTHTYAYRSTVQFHTITPLLFTTVYPAVAVWPPRLTCTTGFAISASSRAIIAFD